MKIFWMNYYSLSDAQLGAIRDIHCSNIDVVAASTSFSFDIDVANYISGNPSGFIYLNEYDLPRFPIAVAQGSPGIHLGLFYYYTHNGISDGRPGHVCHIDFKSNSKKVWSRDHRKR